MRHPASRHTIRFTSSSQHTSAHLCGWLVTILLALWTTGPATLRAESQDVYRFPLGGLPPANGLQMFVDLSGVDNNGYRPIKFSIQSMPPVPSATNRTLKIELDVGFDYYHRQRQTLVGYATLPAGATSVETVVSLPLMTEPYFWTLQTSEDGQVLKDLSQSDPSGWNNVGWNSEAVPAILIIDNDAPPRDQRTFAALQKLASVSGTTTPPVRLPDLRQLPNMLMTRNQYPTGTPVTTTPYTDLSMMQLVGQMSNVQLSPFSDLPRRWIDLSCFDMAFISAADLRTLIAQQPERWRAIRDWLATGPTLCVYDLKLTADELQTLERELGVERLAVSGTEADKYLGWRAPLVTDAMNDTITALQARNRDYGYDYGYSASGGADGSSGGTDPTASGADPSASGANANGSPAEPTPPAPTGAPFVMREVGFGRVVAIESAEPFLQTRYALPLLLNELGSKHWMWYQRHGISMRRDNAGYWNWMVPGVGAAPVGTFLLLITIFVIVIGPVNYLWLRRSRRLYLLLVTVPAGAGIITLALFLYALIADGLGTRVRVRAVMELDHRNGRMASWSRQSYYAGLAPSGGLRFPAQAAVYPIFATNSEHPKYLRLVWDEDQRDEAGTVSYGDQLMVSGYLGSRSMQQYLVVSSGPLQGGLKIVEDAADANTVRVTNQWPVPLQDVAVWDSRGHCYLGANIAAGGTAELPRSHTAAALQALPRLGRANPLQYPQGYSDYQFRSNRGRIYFYDSNDYNLPQPDFMTSILENQLAIDFNPDSPANASLTRTYIATTDVSPGVPLGLAEVDQESSIYLIRGRW